MKIRPLADHIVVKPLEVEDKTSGGIILPETAKEKSTKGEVIAVGKGRLLKSGKYLELEVKVGDRVIYGSYAGQDVKIDDDEMKILGEGEILAVIQK